MAARRRACILRAELNGAFAALDSGEYGAVLRAKGIVAGPQGWLHFDYVPGEGSVRAGAPDYTGRICVIGAGLADEALRGLFHLLKRRAAMALPLYVFLGFLEAGKTSFIQETLEDPDFNTGEKTLLVLCEDGETEYEPQKFAGGNVAVLPVEAAGPDAGAFGRLHQKAPRGQGAGGVQRHVARAGAV